MKKIFLCLSMIFLMLISACEMSTLPNENEGQEYSLTFISKQEILDLEIDSYIAGEEVLLPELEDTETLEFIGWYSNPNFNGEVVTTITKEDYGDKTFYAKWNEQLTPSPVVVTLKEYLKEVNNYEYTFTYSDDDTSYDYSYSATYEYLNGNLRIPYEYEGVNYVDYLGVENNLMTYYYQEDDNSYTIYDETNEYFEYVVSYVDFAYLSLINPEHYEFENGKWIVAENYLQEEAANILNGVLENETFLSLEITTSDSAIDSIVITSIVDSEEYGIYHPTYSISFKNFGNISFSLPNVENNTDNSNRIEDAYDALDNETVTVVGSIVGIVGNNFYLSDGEYGIYVYLGSSGSNFSIGETLKVTGTKTTYRGLVEITNPSNMQVVDQYFDVEPFLIYDLTDVEYLMSMNLNVSYLEVVSLPSSYSKDIKLEVSDGQNTICLFASQHLDDDYRDNLIKFIKSLSIGQLIDLENVVVSYFDGYQLVFTEQSLYDISYTEKVLNGISTNKNTVSVSLGTTLDTAMEQVIVYKDYSDGTKEEADVTEYEYSSSTYNALESNQYKVTIKLDNYEATIFINVCEENNQLFKPEEGSVDLLEDVVKNFGITRGMPSVGDAKALVIPVEFTDYKATSTMKQDLEITFFGTSEQTGWESLSSYYYKASYGKLNITGTVLDVYNTGKSSTYYTNLYNQGKDADYEIIKSALEYYDSSVDYSDYDSDGDGYIDALYIIYTAPVDYESADSMWWAYTYEYYTDDYEYYDGVEADFYFFAGYEFVFEQPACGKNLKYNAETFIHETGHILGLDDYYDYDETKGPDGGIGGGDMMDYNVGDHNAFTKIILGWVTPYVVTNENVTIDLLSFGSTGDCVLICDSWNGTYFDEYYIIDYYTPDGLNAFEAGYSGLFSTDGIRIYHIDAHLKEVEVYSAWEIYEMNNSDTSHKLISLVQASGSNSIEDENDYSSDSDLFKEKDSFKNAKWYDGTSCGFTLTVDKIENGIATITITF